MPTTEQIQHAITEVHDQESFIQNLLMDTLGWQIPDGIEEIEDISFDWTQEELGAEDLDQHLIGGQLYQIQPMHDYQPWGIFVLEFKNEDIFTSGRGLTGPLRKILRGLVPKRRGNPDRPTWERENLLFICTHEYRHFRFAYFKSPLEKGHAEPLTLFGWSPDTPARTACELNLPHLVWPEDPEDITAWVKEWAKAFDVEAVTKKFYEDYENVFNNLQTCLDLDDEDKKMFAQVLMNRLMFLRFIERKGWLRFNDTNPKEYLKNLFLAGPVGGESWYRSRLKVLLFEGLAVPNHNREDIIGSVPYLNGGLFTPTRWDNLVDDIADDTFEPILGEHGLLYRYNFTVEESTPLDVEVAVDPEMLGKVFEKLVTARREQGSYYTPRTVVSFMCRETLKGYLGANYAPLIDEHKNDDISIVQARELLAKLAELKVVDPACGSGAYLLGMLQELYTITEFLDSRAEEETARDAYQRKLLIILNNIYGVDLDEFAVNIARLRLWLSLAVDYQGDQPDPLPNLDFKIEIGDSLTAYDPSGGVEPGLHQEVFRQYVQLKKDDFMPSDEEKRMQRLKEIEEKKESIRSWIHPSGSMDGFEWQVEFLEVFVNGGFDIVIANPPYGIKVDTSVRNQYFNQRIDSERGQSKDSYGIFMARGLQLLKPDGTMSYIVSDTWRTIKSHKPLRKRILDTTTVSHFLDLPAWIFDATVNTGIITFKNAQIPQEHKLIAGDLRGIEQGDWKTLSDNLIAVSGHGPDIQTINCARYTYPQSLIVTYDNSSFFVGSPPLYELMTDEQFTKLDDIADVKYGIRTGDNRQFLYKSLNARGSYDVADIAMVLTSDEIYSLSREEKLNGFLPTRFNGKYLVPLDRGQASDAEGGLLPNYSIITEYFIDWSRESVDRIKELRGMRNPEYYFKKGISFSWTGYYAPTFRENSASVFDQSSSCVFFDNMPIKTGLAILCSKYIRYSAKCLINHTVNSDVNTIKSLPMLQNIEDYAEQTRRLDILVVQIMTNQQTDAQYLYHLLEQKEIDTLIYELYGLSEDDIREVELWYCRRYARLADAQGVMAEVKEKYAGHLDRCQRILEKPPSYWRSNPVLELIAQGESHTLEFKETLQYNIHTSQVDNDVFHSSLKTMAAFMNADGGTLLIGVSDAGEIKGIDRDIRSLGRNANNDRFEIKIRDCLSGQNSRLDPAATGNVNISFVELQEGTICRVDVQPLPNSAVLHFDNEVYLRDGNRTIKLEGPALTNWIQHRRV